MTLAFLNNETGLIVLVILVIVLFGGSQLPKIARNMGSAGKEFRKAQEEAERDAETKEKTAPAATPPAPVAVAQSTSDDKVTLSKTELDALLAEREERARRQASAS